MKRATPEAVGRPSSPGSADEPGPGDGRCILQGRVGAELTLEEGRQAAGLTALSAVARIHQALGGLERLESLLRADGYVASADTFVDQPEVLDGASELFLRALGERGRRARTAFAYDPGG